MTNEERQKEQRELVSLGYALAGVKNSPYPGGQSFVMLPDGNGGMKLEFLAHPTAPVRKTGIVTAFDADSFVNAVKRHKDKATVIYASLKPGSFVAVLNDHEDAPGWKDHRVVFPLTHSEEYRAWSEHDKGSFDQEDFAYFIEDNMPDFKTPSGARMLEIAINFRVKQGVHFNSGVRLQDGTIAFEYTEDNVAHAGAGGKLSIPEKFTISIPVWAGLDQEKYEIDALLRWKLDQRKLSIRYELQRPHKVVEQAFADTLQKIKTDLEIDQVLFGEVK